jgi:hypothetical protein
MADFQLLLKFNILSLKIVDNLNILTQPLEYHHLLIQEISMEIKIVATKEYSVPKELIIEVVKIRLSLEKLAWIGEVITHTHILI